MKNIVAFVFNSKITNKNSINIKLAILEKNAVNILSLGYMNENMQNIAIKDGCNQHFVFSDEF